MVIASLLMTHVQMVPDVWDLAGLIGAKAINQALFSENEEVSHLVRLDSSRLQAPSTLFAAAAIRTLWQADRLSMLDVVEEVIANAWEGGRRGAPFHRIARDLMRYSVVKFMVPRSGRNEHVLEYYDRIRNLDACANNDLFWLQFTIAAVDAGLFDQAQRHIETSYKIARRRTGYRTDQHDNVMASFLLAREAAEPDASRAFQSFVEARRIIATQMADGNHKYYPFRVAQRYGDFWRGVAKRWPEPNRGLFLRACREVLERLDVASAGIAKMDDLAACRAQILSVLAEA